MGGAGVQASESSTFISQTNFPESTKTGTKKKSIATAIPTTTTNQTANFMKYSTPLSVVNQDLGGGGGGGGGGDCNGQVLCRLKLK